MYKFAELQFIFKIDFIFLGEVLGSCKMERTVQRFPKHPQPSRMRSPKGMPSKRHVCYNDKPPSPCVFQIMPKTWFCTLSPSQAWFHRREGAAWAGGHSGWAHLPLRLFQIPHTFPHFHMVFRIINLPFGHLLLPLCCLVQLLGSVRQFCERSLCNNEAWVPGGGFCSTR